MHAGSHSLKDPKSVRTTNFRGHSSVGAANFRDTNCGPLKFTEHSGDFVEIKGPRLRGPHLVPLCWTPRFLQSPRMVNIVQFNGRSRWPCHNAKQYLQPLQGSCGKLKSNTSHLHRCWRCRTLVGTALLYVKRCMFVVQVATRLNSSVRRSSGVATG